MLCRAILCVLFVCLFKGNLVAECSDSVAFVSCEKTYISHDQIEFFKNRIFVKIENFVISTSAIYVDQNGYYFKDFQSDCEGGEWKCIHCETCNPYWNTLCKKCHRVNWKTN